MDVAKNLVQEIFSWLKLQEESTKKLKNLATEMEERQKTINVTKVVGSSVSVGGAAALTVAAGITLLTGGLAIPFMGAAATVASVAGLATNVTSDLVGAAKSKDAMEEAEKITEKLQNLGNKIKEFMKLLRKEWLKEENQDISEKDYVMKQIVKEIARRNGFAMNDYLYNKMSEKTSGDSLLNGSMLDLPLLSKFITTFAAEQADEFKLATTSALRAGAAVTVNVLGKGAEYAVKAATKEAAEEAVKVTAANVAAQTAIKQTTEQAAKAAAKQAVEQAAKAAAAKAATKATAKATGHALGGVFGLVSSKTAAEEAAKAAAKAATKAATEGSYRVMVARTAGGKAAERIIAKATAEEAAKVVAARAAAKEAVEQAAKAAATKAAAKATAKAAGRALGGAIGLVFSVPELISNCKDLNKCDTNASRILRENANAIQTTADQMREELDNIEKLFRQLATENNAARRRV